MLSSKTPPGVPPALSALSLTSFDCPMFFNEASSSRIHVQVHPQAGQFIFEPPLNAAILPQKELAVPALQGLAAARNSSGGAAVTCCLHRDSQ